MTLGADTLRKWIVDYIASVLDMDSSKLPTDETFAHYGFDSAEAVIMAGVMEEELGIEVDPTLFFENPSIDAAVAALTTQGGASV